MGDPRESVTDDYSNGSTYDVVDQMANLDINNQHSGGHPQTQGSQGYFNPPPGQAGHNDWSSPSESYGTPGPSPGAHEFGPPARSRTMPMNDPNLMNMGPPKRTGTMPLNSLPGRPGDGRPSTSSSSHPPQRKPVNPHQGIQPDPHRGHETGQGQGFNEQTEASYDDGFNSYYGSTQPSHAGYPSHEGSISSLPEFDSRQSNSNSRGSFEQSIRPTVQQSQSSAHQTAQVGHARSQPNLRQPQVAVIEMAPDVPDMPPTSQMHMYQNQQSYEPNYGASGGYNHAGPRAPSVPPGSGGGAANERPYNGPLGKQAYPQGRSPDRAQSSSSHPTPVRPGLMANSMVNVAERPPPVRNYTGVSQATSTPSPMAGPPQQNQSTQRPAPKIKQPEAPVTSGELEQLRMTIKNNPHDQASALKLAKRLVAAADVLAPNMPDPKSRNRARERYIQDAQKVLKKLANAQNPEAMFFLADCLGRGLFGNEADNKEAFTLYLESAKLGFPAAAYRTAVCCEIGHEEGGGTRKDPLKAIQWYKRAAQLGDPPGMYKMGMILLKGLLGQYRNPHEAISWLKRAADVADSENPHALHELGLLYEATQPNEAVIRDERYALSLFQQAADIGYKFSQFRLGCAFEFGLMGCRIDPRQSIRWYSQAAQQEEHQSELALSGWYLTGSEGVLGQSDTEAYLWARKAAMAGLAKAEYAMGYFTEVGIGVQANLEDAKRWYWRAAGKLFPL